VAFPAFSRIQENKEQCREYFLTAAQLLGLITFPMLWGLSSVSNEFISVVLGDKWSDAAIVLTLIPLVIPLKAIDMILTPMVEGVGRPDVGLRNVITISIILPAMIIAGINWGIVGVSTLYAIGYIPVLYLNCRRSLALLDTSFWELLLRLRIIIFCAGMMYLAVYFARTGYLAEFGVEWRLAGSVMVGGLVFGGLSWLLNRSVVMNVVSLVRNR
jgi:O-antigen/teichoic acid export membrane protein